MEIKLTNEEIKEILIQYTLYKRSKFEKDLKDLKEYKYTYLK